MRHTWVITTGFVIVLMMLIGWHVSNPNDGTGSATSKAAPPPRTDIIVDWYAFRPGGPRGLLKVRTTPVLGAEVAVDGVNRNTDAVRGLPLDRGTYMICFEPITDHLPPPCAEVDIAAGMTLEVTGTYRPAGTLQVTTEPSDTGAQIEVDGIARDAGEVVLPVAAGTRQVCVEPPTGHASVDCVEVEVPAGETTRVTFTFEPITEP